MTSNPTLPVVDKIDNNLLPCPFCGNPGEIVHKHYKANYQGGRSSFTGLFSMPARTIWFVRCSNKDKSCLFRPVTTYQSEKEDALKVWNQRKEQS